MHAKIVYACQDKTAKAVQGGSGSSGPCRAAGGAGGGARQAVVAADQTASCVIAITAIAMRARYSQHQEKGAMASIHTYDGWWDLSLIDDRNERALLSAFVAVIAVWATAVLFALV